MFAASRRSGARCRPAESNENSLGTPADPLPTRSPRSPLISIQDPSRNPSDGPTGSGTSDSKKCLGDIPIKAPRSLQSLTARGSPRVSHGNGVHTALVRERGYSSRVLSAAAEVRSSVPVEVPYFEPHDEPSFWNDHNVQVLIRIRPLSGMEVAMQGYKRCLVQESSQTLTWAEHPETRFTFDHVACESMSQEKLFKVVGLPMVENCMSGYNSCMFAYGQTGSGKTYTMMGEIHEMDSGLSEDRGITPRIFEYLFTRIREEEVIRSGEQLKYSCKCSFLEIYNEQITDLLQPSPTNLQLREDLNKGVYVENLKEHEVSSVKDVFELLLQGAANRKIAATHMNSESSRSHSVFTCIIESRWEKDSMTHLRFGRLNLVDLAGSERQKSSGAEGGRLKEAANINRSLSTLGLVIMTLVEIANGKHRHVPYRDSKLTFLLQDSLGGNSKTAIIANVSPSICSASETLSTLKFAQRAKLIQNNAKVNEDASGDVMALQQQIQKLKDQLTLLTKNQSIPTLLCYPSAILEQPNSGDFDNVSNSAPRGSPDSFNNTGLLNKKMNYLEATLLGSLRREKIADATVRRLEADISHMNRLAHQRENDAHQMKRLLKFREEKLKRLELLADDLISSDGYLMEENTALSEEIQLLRERIDRNPELTQFALENKRLLEQIRMFEDFYQQGEREKLLDEISHLRNQFLKFLDEKFAVPNGDSSQNDDAIRELDSCRRQLSACQEYNDRLTRELDSLCHQLKEYHDDARQTKSLGVDPNLAEGCSEDGIASCEQVNLISHINTDPRMGDIVPSQLMNVQKELRDARILVKAMDLQQIRLTEELDTLKQENIRYFELLQGKVYDGTGAEDADKLALDATLERTHKDHKESKTFDMHLQDNHASQLICKIEMKHIPDRFEADTAKTILYLQKELAELQQHVHLMKASQLPAKEDSFLSKTKYEELHNKFCILTQENDRLSNLVAIKDAEISTLSDDWEKAIIELTNFLIDGWRSLEDASDCIGSVVHSFPRGNEWISGHVERAIEVFIEREKSIANLQKSLEDAQKMGLEMELKLNSLKGATLAVTEVQQLENDQNSKELSHLSQLLGEKVSRVHELENIIKRKEDDLMEVEKSAKAANAVIRKLRAMSSVESFDLAAESMISELVNADPLLRMDSDFPWCETKYAQNKDMDMSSKVLLPFPIEHNSVGNRKLKAEADLSYLRKIDIHVEMAKKMVMDSNVALCTLYADTEKYFGSLLSDINSTYAAVKMLIGSLINDFRVANKEFKRLKEQRKISPPIMIGYSSFNAPDTSKSANNSTVVNIMIDRFRETCALLSSIQVGFNSLFGLCGDATQDEREICPGTDLQHVHKSPRYGKSEQYEELSSPNSALIRHMREESEQAMGSLREMHFHLSMLLDGSEQRDVTGCPAGGLCSNELPAIGKNPSLSHTNHRRPSDQLAMMELCQILQTLEERLKEVDANCSETRQVLSHKLSYARHDAQEKSKPTDDLFLKFEQAQHIMEEAEFVLNALLIANEDVKHERDCCKQANEELHKEKVALTEEVQRLEASNLSEARHFKSLQEQIQMSLTDILNIISTFQGTSQRANLVVGAEPNANCSDIVSLGYEVLQCIQTSRSWLEDIMSDIVEKDFELFALHQCHSGLKSEEMAATLRQVQHELATKTAQIDNILVEQKLREPNLAVNEAAVSSSRYDLEQAQNEIGILSSENDVLRHLLEDAEMKQKHAEELLVDKTKIIESSLNICRGSNMHTSVEEISDELTKVKIERDNLCAEIAYLNDKLEMASALADENEAIAVEAHQIAEVSKIYAEDKEEEVKILERSVEALEDTINIMERKVSDMKEEVESYRLIRKGLELEVQALTRRMSTVANAAEVVLPEDTNVAEGNSQIPRHYDDICQARKHIEDLETEKVYLTKEAKQYREHISELVLHSEAQSSIYQEKFKELELMLSEIKRDPSVSNPSDSIANTTNKISLRPRGSRSNSPFKCITSLVQQVSSEKDHELSLARRRIEELEALAVNRQTEVCMLTARLAAVDSMTHDVIRDLLGVKIDMTNYANLIDGEQLQKLLEKVQEQSKESNTKDNEILDLKKQINYLMEERDRWIEEINQRKADVLGSQVTVEQHKQRDQLLTAQNELLKLDKANLQRRIAELDKEVRLLIRQQKAHNQMPKENNRHTVGSDELSKRLAESDKLLYHAKS